MKKIICALFIAFIMQNVNAQTKDTVILKPVTVSTGYQEVSKESLTGSAERIDSSLFNRSVTTDVLSRLDGVSSSVYFSKVHAKPEIYIRGISTINAGTAPLIVLDNFPYEGDINNINPNDVESITVLKDAASAAIWGAKAGNGVIVITSKKGKYGVKPQLSFNMNFTVQPPPDLFKDRSFFSSSDFIDLEKFLFSKGKYDADLTNTTTRPLVSPVVELLAKVRSGQLLQASADSAMNIWKGYDIRNDYEKYFYRNGLSRQYALNFSGGGGNINYYLSGGLDQSDATLVGNTTQRITFYSALTFHPLRSLEIYAGINYTNSTGVNDGIASVNPGNGKTVLYPYARLADDNGNPLAVEKGYRQVYTDTAGAGLLLDWKYRPLDELKFADNTSHSADLLFKGRIAYHFTSSFSAEISGQLEKTNGDARNFYSTDTYFTRDLINRYSQRTGATIKRNIPLGGILDNTNSTLSAYGLRGQLNYIKQLQKWTLNIIGGGEVRESHSESQGGRTYGYDPNILAYQNVDYLSNFTLYGNLGTAPVTNPADFEEGTARFLSAYTNASVTFRDKYIFSASARKDASNIFGVATNQKWNPLWSAGFAWKVSPGLKLRTSYGYNGNIESDLSSLATINYSSASSVTNLIYAIARNAPNPDLRWEQSRIWNIGIDFATRKRAVEGSLEYYHKDSRDLLGPAPLDPTTGVTQMTVNSADLTGKGMDVTINAKILDKQVKANIHFLFSYVTNRIDKYLVQTSVKGAYVGYGDIIVPIEGQDPYALVSYRWGGLDPKTGDPLGYDGDTLSKNYGNIINSSSWDDLVIGGTTRPPFFGNILPSVSWKGLSLSVNISYKFGYYFRRNSLNYSTLFSGWLGNSEYVNRWQKPGDEAFTNVPSLVYPANSNRDKFYNYSEATVEKGDNIRLQNISISYSPKLRAKFIKSVQLYSYINNLGLLWRANHDGLDPDYGSALPPRPSFSFGIKATF